MISMKMVTKDNIGETVLACLPKEFALRGIKWKLIIAAESKSLKKGTFSLIKIEEIEIPPNSVLIPVGIVKHDTLEVVDILSSEKLGFVDTAVIYTARNGEVRKGEILSLLKISRVIPVKKNKATKVLKLLNKKLETIENDVERAVTSTNWPLW